MHSHNYNKHGLSLLKIYNKLGNHFIVNMKIIVEIQKTSTPKPSSKIIGWLNLIWMNPGRAIKDVLTQRDAHQ